jgi:hypothetical protein
MSMPHNLHDVAPPASEDSDPESELARARREIERAKSIIEAARRAVARSKELRAQMTRKPPIGRDEI